MADCRSENDLGARDGAVFSCLVRDSNNKAIVLSIGHAFEHVDGEKGIVVSLDRTGHVTCYRQLWDQNFIDENHRGAITALRPCFVLETDVVIRIMMPPERIKRLFVVNPFPLVTSSDMAGHGNAVVVGCVSHTRGGAPWSVCGVCAVPATILLRVLKDNARYFEGGICYDSLKALVAAQIEDAIRDMAWVRSENKDRSSSIEMRGLLGKQVMGMLYHLGQCSDR